jgi:hypothetical protein
MTSPHTVAGDLGNGDPHGASPPFADTEQVTSRSVAVEHASACRRPGAYTSRRIAQGKSECEIRRCRKRTVARQLYRLLERTATAQASR